MYSKSKVHIQKNKEFIGVAINIKYYASHNGLIQAATKTKPSQSIAEFYAGRSIFLTGGSGFIGKQLIEKLLRSCPKIGRIFVLLRSSKNQTSAARMQHIFTSPVSLLSLLTFKVVLISNLLAAISVH